MSSFAHKSNLSPQLYSDQCDDIVIEPNVFKLSETHNTPTQILPRAVTTCRPVIRKNTQYKGNVIQYGASRCGAIKKMAPACLALDRT